MISTIFDVVCIVLVVLSILGWGLMLWAVKSSGVRTDWEPPAKPPSTDWGFEDWQG